MTDAERHEFWERGRAEIARALCLRGYGLVAGMAGAPPPLLEGLAPSAQAAFYTWMKRYSFRLCFRDLVIQGRRGSGAAGSSTRRPRPSSTWRCSGGFSAPPG